ncbi:hypothetical protein SPRG_12358 [Saprolegnia parasitica CBS 223.65]|uniref:GST C-terminal domain-containing protein n=1 Tax=Saprolegnia parasitica (strain CBS 223.65) TaxID=695850 RepID=A0A067BUB1_SAPPC|nr:hypothetical protein SPRG_12358 [Saprolegnia parasitica CBS 223.65]KDO21858.1 hypothetical protein SPRG_12358 [Saprolegnia parasitica CBS 223.65]|eukprot:XP_012207415.1 hypothetical protein SPRG_12358 [Saprolegnia parasitica CBS 223.65]
MPRKLPMVPYTSLSAAALEALQSRDETTLFVALVCPWAHRTLWTVSKIDTPVRVLELSLDNMPTSYLRHFNSHGSVPFLLANGRPMLDSVDIAKYLDAMFNNGHLAANDDRFGAAVVQRAEAVFDVAPTFAFLRNADASKKETLQRKMHASLAQLETVYVEDAAAYRSRGPYLLGDRFSLAEILILPLLFRFNLIAKHYHDTEMLALHPVLAGALAAATARPAFQRVTREPEMYLRAFAKLRARH